VTRTVYTFVLKIIYDAAAPQTLQGMITAVANGAEFPFADEATLLELLRRISSECDQSSADGKRKELQT